MKTLIIGKNSNLTYHLAQNIDNVISISAKEISTDISLLSKYKSEKINIIFNNFQSSLLLNNLEYPSQYVSNAIYTTAKVLEYFKGCEINKIIYTSSSSVYGNNILCKESDEVKPLNLHAALKIANEQLIEKFSQENNIEYTITRIFNMYGGNDNFSIISKIIKAVQTDGKIKLINNGNAIRDFIYIDDVVEIYKKLLSTKINKVNIGSGKGISIRILLDFLSIRGISLKITNISKKELQVSTADITDLSKIIDTESFLDVQSYLVKELKL